MKATMYWFGFLSFSLLSSLLYLLLRRQPWIWMLVAYLSSLSIAMLATESLVILGQQQAELEKRTIIHYDKKNPALPNDPKHIPDGISND